MVYSYSIWIYSLLLFQKIKEPLLTTLLEIIKELDLGIMLGCETLLQEIQEFCETVHQITCKLYPFKESKKSFHFPKEFHRNSKNNIITQERPTLSEFKNNYYSNKLPVVLLGCIEDWSALKYWKDPDYIKSICGYRFVPIEQGSNYTSSDWSQNLMTISDYIDQHILKEDSTHYLAQHQIIDQISQLRKEIYEPIYCSSGKGFLQSINGWFGPKGTISPLHTDIYDNLFIQVVGYKYIRLYPPEETSNLYPRDDIFSNTSMIINIDQEYKEFPKFKQAKFQEYILNPGDMLFIPKGYWHYVESLSISFSISYWFI